MEKVSSYIVSIFMLLLFAVPSFAEQDYNLWKNDITNRNSTYSVSHVSEGSGFKAKATITIGGALVEQGPHRSTLWDAYKALRIELLNGVPVTPISTTVQRDALGNIFEGRWIWNITEQRLEIYSGIIWISSAGAGTLSPVAYGEMNVDSGNGDALNSSTHNVVTFTAGLFDGNTIVTFSDNSTGDRIVIGADGAGVYNIHYSCNFTNAGGKDTIGAVYKNGTELSKTKDTHAGDSSDIRDLRGAAFETLAVNDYLTMNMVSETPSDEIKTYQCNIIMQRMD